MRFSTSCDGVLVASNIDSSMKLRVIANKPLSAPVAKISKARCSSSVKGVNGSLSISALILSATDSMSSGAMLQAFKVLSSE